MTERKKTESTSGNSFTESATGSGRASTQRIPAQANRLTYESVRATIGTRQASLLERKTLPPITKLVECEFGFLLRLLLTPTRVAGVKRSSGVCVFMCLCVSK